MDRRRFLARAVQGAAMTAAVAQEPGGERVRREPAPLMAHEPVVVYRAPDPSRVYAYSPGLTVLPDGTFIATFDHEHTLRGETCPDGSPLKGRIYASTDGGVTWEERATMPIYHARPFVAGDSVYVLGHNLNLGMVRSDDQGRTWSSASWLTEGQEWHQAPCNVHYAGGRVYLVMERVTDPSWPEWPVSVMAPVLMSAPVDADLTKRDAWVFSSELTWRDVVKEFGKPNLVGVPFFHIGDATPEVADDHRPMASPGWLETNVVQFTDPNHLWFDPTGRTFHLWMRAHTGSTNFAAILKAVESEDRTRIAVSVERAPSGEPLVLLPCPGGHMKFHILYDAPSERYWLLASQPTDSMTRPDRLPANRFNLPSNERQRLVLYFSKNCVDWCFAGRVDDTGDYGQSRHYASMAIYGDDLFVLSRSGDVYAKSAHDTNLITFHTVRDFRKLVY